MTHVELLYLQGDEGGGEGDLFSSLCGIIAADQFTDWLRIFMN